jgi:hypothetical protein
LTALPKLTFLAGAGRQGIFGAGNKCAAVTGASRRTIRPSNSRPGNSQVPVLEGGLMMPIEIRRIQRNSRRCFQTTP